MGLTNERVAFSPGTRSILAFMGHDTLTPERERQLEDLRQRYPDLQVATEEEAMFKLEQSYCTEPETITEAQYQAALDAVPPLRMMGTTFLQGELLMGSVGAWFTCLGRTHMRMQARSKLSYHEVYERFAEAEERFRKQACDAEAHTLASLGLPVEDETTLGIDETVSRRRRAA